MAHAPPLGVVWLKSGTPAECTSAAQLRKKFPWLLEGTDFYDGSHVVCNHTSATTTTKKEKSVPLLALTAAATTLQPDGRGDDDDSDGAAVRKIKSCFTGTAGS